jgi:hypothetical protein
VVIYRQPGDCSQPQLAAVVGLGSIDTADLDPLPGTPSGATRCFAAAGGAYVDDEAVGEGHLITLAGPELWVNDVMRTLDQPSDEAKGPMADNVVTAAALLTGHGDRVDVVTSGLHGVPVGGAGKRGLLSFVPTGVKLALWEGVAALALFALVRSRRWGKVVDEPLPVTISGSELVVARAGLMERRRDPAHAAVTVRADAVSRIGEALGLGRNAPVGTVVAVLAGRTGRDPAEVADVLAGRPPGSDADLVRLVHRIDRLEEDLHHDVHHPA